MTIGFHPRGRPPLDPRGRTRNGCSQISVLRASMSWDSFSTRQPESKDHELQLAAVIPQSKPLCGTIAHRCTARNAHEIRITPKAALKKQGCHPRTRGLQGGLLPFTPLPSMVCNRSLSPCFIISTDTP